MKITQKQIERFIALTSGSSYNSELKEEYKKLGRKILKSLAEIMGLQKGEFDIHWNPGGIAISGDHILHTDWFYLALDDNINCGWFYYRTCTSRKDYTGGHNRITHWHFLKNYGLEELAKAINRDCPRPVTKTIYSTKCCLESIPLVF